MFEKCIGNISTFQLLFILIRIILFTHTVCVTAVKMDFVGYTLFKSPAFNKPFIFFTKLFQLIIIIKHFTLKLLKFSILPEFNLVGSFLICLPVRNSFWYIFAI